MGEKLIYMYLHSIVYSKRVVCLYGQINSRNTITDNFLSKVINNEVKNMASNKNVNKAYQCAIRMQEQLLLLKYEQKAVVVCRYIVNIVGKELRKYVKTFAFKVSAAAVIIAGLFQLYYAVAGV